jgi:plasmid maintenance system antidote protein VapI
MSMHNHPHPGEFIQEIYMEPFSITGRQLAAKLDVAPFYIKSYFKREQWNKFRNGITLEQLAKRLKVS